MAVAFRSLVEGTKQSLSRNFMLKNAMRARINYKSSSTLSRQSYIHLRRTPVNVKTSILSSHIHTTGVANAEIVKFHLSDIGMYNI